MQSAYTSFGKKLGNFCLLKHISCWNFSNVPRPRIWTQNYVTKTKNFEKKLQKSQHAWYIFYPRILLSKWNLICFIERTMYAINCKMNVCKVLWNLYEVWERWTTNKVVPRKTVYYYEKLIQVSSLYTSKSIDFTIINRQTIVEPIKNTHHDEEYSC